MAHGWRKECGGQDPASVLTLKGRGLAGSLLRILLKYLSWVNMTEMCVLDVGAANLYPELYCCNWTLAGKSSLEKRSLAVAPQSHPHEEYTGL